MIGMLKRAEELANAARKRKLGQVAEHLRALLGSASIDVENVRVVVGGRRLLQRWLADPRLRFIAGNLK